MEIVPRYIEMKAEKCKTRRLTLVTINPTLRAWLGIDGTLPMRNAWPRLAALKNAVRKAGVTFLSNAARHSFCSYHYAHFGSAAQTSKEAGHSESMLFTHYRELVTAEAAAEFWAIRPLPTENPTPEAAAAAPSRKESKP